MPDESNPFQPEPSPPPKSDVRRIAEIMDAHGVEYLVIGGQAETLMGSPRVTYDVDLCYRRTPENLAKLAIALRSLQARLRNVPADVPVILDARSLQMGTNFTFHTSIVDLDILGYVEPIGEYDDLNKSAETYRLTDGQLVRTISLDDLLRVKRTIKRFKDSESLFQLTAIKRLRDGA
jgi:predicted nucleotidyltransferase